MRNEYKNDLNSIISSEYTTGHQNDKNSDQLGNWSEIYIALTCRIHRNIIWEQEYEQIKIKSKGKYAKYM
jgi:hypothetical protein